MKSRKQPWKLEWKVGAWTNLEVFLLLEGAESVAHRHAAVETHFITMKTFAGRVNSSIQIE